MNIQAHRDAVQNSAVNDGIYGILSAPFTDLEFAVEIPELYE